MNTEPTKRKPRVYRRITPDVVTRTKIEAAIQGNATAAVRALEPDLLAPHIRANRIMQHDKFASGAQYLDEALDQIARPAIDRVASVLASENEKNALRAAMFVTDHVRGKAVQRTENKNYNLTIEAVLD